MKKIIAFLIVLALAVSVFAGCSGGNANPGGDTTAKQGGTDSKPEDTKKSGETTPKAEDTTKKAEETDDPNALPTVRTLYNNDTNNISKVALLDFGFEGKVVINKRTAFGYAPNVVMSPEGILSCEAGLDSVAWDVKPAVSQTQWTWDGTNSYMPFTYYRAGITINEIIMADVTNWSPETPVFKDYSDLQIWYTDDPEDTWTRWDCEVKGTENWPSDEPNLRGTYRQCIQFIGPEVTAKYFIMWDESPAKCELWTVAGGCSFYGVYDPANVK
ncbi:MAG: hypothetical protein IKX86_02175 [Clostridia bacterium]|nr:hypothetical protein [Clostridia bacterium]